MNEKEVTAILDKDIKSIPGLIGVSNHEGSRATEDRELMTIILKDLKKRKLFFFDSMVTQESVCRDVASALELPYARRDIFLDNIDTIEKIDNEVTALEKIAFKKGRAIAP